PFPASASNYGPGMTENGTDSGIPTYADRAAAQTSSVPDYQTWKASWIAENSQTPYFADYLAQMTEGDFAYLYYYKCMVRWEWYNSCSSAYFQAVDAQYTRISENPTAETATAEMVSVEIPVWHLSNGQKVPAVTTVTVMSSIAEEVKAIFTEIYNGPEQFPIQSVGGYAWRDNGLSSSHSVGLAIDINPEQNPQVAPDGTVLVGGAWEPYVNPYSITPDGDVARAFGKYGWTWGTAFSTKDYMHFSF
ncbi:MAG: M15 family metallopeptidase, partial [Lachnospiraceae bacterium]|nr:M15 family metallopeptidase [Lachnospiraceae bacterium]